MSSINTSISRVRSLLLSPKEQRPTADQLFNSLTMEYQNFVNEIDSTNLPWLYNSQTVRLNGNFIDYLVTNPTGKVLFVTANTGCNCHGAIPLEFADLADISSNCYLFSPLDWGVERDFGEAWAVHFPFQIAFYRKDGDLWFRLAPNICGCALSSITIVYSTGDWLENLSTDSVAVLTQHHQLVEVRTALNLLPGTEWIDNAEANQAKRVNLDRSLSRQEARYAQQFLYGKRMMTADLTTSRVSLGEYW